MSDPMESIESVTTLRSAAPLGFQPAAFYRPLSRMLAAFAGMFLVMTEVSSVQAQIVTVNPIEAPSNLTNPGDALDL